MHCTCEYGLCKPSISPITLYFKDVYNCDLTANRQNSPQNFLKDCLSDITLRLALIKIAVSFLIINSFFIITGEIPQHLGPDHTWEHQGKKILESPRIGEVGSSEWLSLCAPVVNGISEMEF